MPLNCAVLFHITTVQPLLRTMCSHSAYFWARPISYLA